MAGEATIDRDQPPPSSPPALTPDVPANALRSPLGAAEVAEASDEPVAAGERRARAVKEKRRKARRRARGRAKGIAAGRPEKAPANAGKKAKPPKKLPGYERPPESAPARGLPPERPVRPEPAAPVKPLREPKEKVVAKPAPTDRSRRVKPAP